MNEKVCKTFEWEPKELPCKVYSHF